FLARGPPTVVGVSRPGVLSSSYTRLLAAAVDALRGGGGGLSMLMIGGGGYALPRYWREEGCWAEMTVAEIDPVVQRAAVEHMDAAPAPWMRYVARDGRAEVDALLADGRGGAYDFVIGDTVSDAAVPYHLVTREFNEKVKALLAPGGFYLVHVLDRYEGAGFLASMLRTLGETFPCVEVFCYSGVTDVRQSWVAVAGEAPVDMGAVMGAVAARHPEAKGFYLTGEQKARLAAQPGALCFTDRFAPVERYVWRVVSRDVQYRPFSMAKRAVALWGGGRKEAALALAREVLRVQPEQPDALRVLRDGMRSGLLAADEGLGLLRAQAERLSVMPDARVLYAEALVQNGRAQEAVPVWADLHACWPDNENYALAWLDARIRSGDKEGVREWLWSGAAAGIGFERREAFLERCR
ncbi:MAG: fused MFS/spermidine synthase, partial [Kiritimatiellaeota bacterium]|nr:fused MFS/spermidine synthase [Kiritimatiellota bacterium]